MTSHKKYITPLQASQPLYRVRVMIINEDSTVTVECRTAIKTPFLYLNLCLSEKLDSLLCSCTSIYLVQGPSWSYGSWIYNYMCHQCLSQLTLWVRTLSWRGVLDITLCVRQWFATGRLLSPGTPVSSINKADRHNITEILLKVALSTVNQPTYS